MLPLYYLLSSLILVNFFPCLNLNFLAHEQALARQQDRGRIRPSSLPLVLHKAPTGQLASMSNNTQTPWPLPFDPKDLIEYE